MSKKVRMADIAEKLNISIVSVSKTLAGKEGVSQNVRQKILDTAKEMGYLKNEPVRQEKILKGIIGILVADRFFSDNAFYSNMYRTILLKSAKLGFSAILQIVSADDERNCVAPNMINSNIVDGIIFMGEIDRNYLKMVCNTGLPYMLLDFYDDEIGGDSVCSDNISGAYKITTHLLEDVGCTRIGFVGDILSTSSILDRYLGYYKALLRNHIPVREDWILKDRDHEGRYIDIVLPEDMPEAFVCSCDEVAYTLLNKLKDNGLRVPKDVCVAGYDDYRYSTLGNIHLTTYHVNVEAMVETVVSRLHKKIMGKNYTQGCVIIDGNFVPRESTQR